MFTITLPSLGKFYDPPIEGGVIHLKPLTAKEEAILYSPGGDPGAKLDQVINRLLLDCPIKASDFLIGDRLYVLLALRTHAYGPEYTIPIRCDFCGIQFKHTVDIAKDLDLKRVSEDVTEPVKLTLPERGVEVECIFLRGYHEDQLNRHRRRMRMTVAADYDPTYSYRMALMLHSINGTTDLPFQEKLAFVESLVAKDTNYLQQKMNDIEPGVDLTLFVSCKECGGVNELILPFTPEFFRPRVR